MRILSVAYPFAAVGRDAAGGAEQILAAIDAGLVAHGYDSTVIACEGSHVAGRLLPVPRCESAIDTAARARVHAAVRAALARAAPDCDLIHLHGVDFPCYLPPLGPPVLATLHLPPGWYDAAIFTPQRPRTWLHCVSRAQHGQCPPSSALLPPIENGVPVSLLAAHRAKRCEFVLTLGRVCPEKGQHLALAAAHRAGVPLLIAGQTFPYAEHLDYFERQVRSLLDARRRWIGPVGFTRKRRLLAAARCLLIPSLAAETSSLVAMEAAACGTPVIAFHAGALPDIVRNGETGFLVGDEDEMAEAIARADRIDPDVCRAEAFARFDEGRMVGAYVETYRWLLT